MRSEKMIKSDETLLDILAIVGENGGITLSELAERTGVSKSTVHGHLGTMEKHGFIYEADGRFWLGLRFLKYGVLARDSRLFYRVAREKIDEIATETGERAVCLVEEHGNVFHLYKAEGEHSVQTDIFEGNEMPLYCTAAGKAILAHLPELERERLLKESSFEKITENTITDRPTLNEELRKTRERGFAFNIEETIQGYNAIAAPVTSIDGGVFGAISVGGPANRLTKSRMVEDVADLLLGAANEIEINVRHHDEEHSSGLIK